MRENPPAFPVELGWGLEPGEAHQTGQHTAQFPGMTLRDYFAGQALPAVIRQCAGDAAFGFPAGVESMEQLFAVKSYAIADALLAQRSQP